MADDNDNAGATGQEEADGEEEVLVVEKLVGRRRFAAALTRHLNRSVFALILLSVPVGIVAAYGASGFRFAFGWLWDWLHTTGHMAEGLWQWAGLAVGGLLIGIVLAILKWDSFRSLGHVMVAAAERDCRLSFRGGIITAVADAFSLALGSSVGRYGPAVQLGATLASVIGQKFGLDRAGLRVLLGCGVAGAISASFNAPIAGAIFAHEVIIGTFALRAFAPVTLASVAAVAVTRYHGFEYIALKLDDAHRQLGLWDYPLYIVVGGLAAVIAILYMKGILGAQRSLHKWKIPIWLQPMIGGIVAGAVGLGVPEGLGLGDYTMQKVLEQDVAVPTFALGALAALLGGKLVASIACLGCRFPGGVFSPALFLGAMLGAVSGMLMPVLDYQICVLVGMGAVVASVVGAPIATILIVFELTENYAAATAVMVGVVASNALVTRFFAPSFFARQIQLWGYDLDRPPQQRIMEQRKLAPMVVAQFFAVRPEQTAAELRTMIQSSHEGDIYVTESDGRLIGKMQVAALLNCDPDETAGNLATFPAHCLTAADTEWQGYNGLKNFIGYSVPVVEDLETKKLIGVVFEAHFIVAYRNAVLQARRERWS